MLKYVAIFHALDNSTLGLDAHQLGRVSCITYKSPVCEKETEVVNWINTTKKAYPPKIYTVHHAIIAFDTDKSENVEEMLKMLIKMSNWKKIL